MKETKISIFKNLFKTRDVPYIITIDECINRIREGKSKELVQKIRNESDKDKRNDYKKQLPCIIFSGEFTERSKKGLEKHSGLMSVDYDGYPDLETMLSHFEELKKIPSMVTLFISPSGLGLKGVIKIPVCNGSDHTKYFKAFEKEYGDKYWDKVTSDVSRVCFESYDPDIYVNYDADTFNTNLIDKGYSVTEKTPLIPIKDDGKIIDFIMSWDWQKDFREGERNNYILDIAGAMCEYGVNESVAESYILNNVVIGDFSELEAKTTISSAYKLRSFGTKYFEDYAALKQIQVDLKRGKEEVLKRHDITEQVYDEIKNEDETRDFWFYVKDKIKVDPLLYKVFLESKGFYKYFPEDALKPNLVRVESNIVSLTSGEYIKDFVLNYLMERQDLDAWSYCAVYANLFFENTLSMLDTIELLMLKDTKNKSYIAYQNGILEVTKNDSKLVSYIDVDGYVWKSHIIQRDFIPQEDTDNDYQQFIHNISNGEPLPIECSVGFLLSTYKSKTNGRAVILNDEIISDNPEGGTGKGLLVQGLKQIRRVSILDGKAFDDKKSFPYQTVSQDTQILVFDDVKKNFDFESKFSLVTEGMTLERKNKDAIKLTPEETPKMVVSTNYAIKGGGNSNDRRRHELEVSQYYGGHLTPYDDFGRHLFDDWNEKDWIAFDNYMVTCLQAYLKDGLIKQNAKNLKIRKFIIETDMDFYEWVSEEGNLPRDQRLTKQTYYNRFVEEYPDYKRWLTQKRFTTWVKKYAKFMGYEYTDGHTQSERWMMIDSDYSDEFDVIDKQPF